MSVYVDPLMNHGYKGNWCHMLVPSSEQLPELHDFAAKIGLKRSWFQGDASIPHYDLTPNKREQAIKAGAIPLTHKERFQVIGYSYEWK